ncbi:hypothetical protein Vafri_15027 [Volvox africanus]|nr:hypothetical protein Vafri_15027 [Volvox africanus]
MKPQSRISMSLGSTVLLLFILQSLLSTTADAHGTKERPELSLSARNLRGDRVQSSSSSRADVTAAQRTSAAEPSPHGASSSAQRVRIIIFVSLAVGLGLAFGAAALANWNLVGKVLDRLHRNWNEMELPLVRPGSSRWSSEADENGSSRHAALLRDYGCAEQP